jgi:uncharacterized protein YjbI with pentapeptide repeats
VPERRQPAALDRSSLRADCERCFALCCVAPAFSASADFAIDKDAGQPCPNLNADFGCSIHDRLRPRGFAGCTVYDCFGAGQKVAQVTFGGQDWRRTPGISRQMFQVFNIVRQLHELLWYLSEALTLEAARPIHGELRPALDETERLTRLGPDALADLDLHAHRRDINALLLRASELARAEARRHQTGATAAGLGGADLGGAGLQGAGLRGADLMGKDLRGADLRGASLRGAYLIGANLRGADLAVADLTGADLRGADLSGADLSMSIFLTQSQLDAAKGDLATRLPASCTSPAHWS